MPVIEASLDSTQNEQTCSADVAVASTEFEPSANSRLLRIAATRRALTIIALGGLLIAGVTVVRSQSHTAPSVARPTNAVFDNARSGDCLNWPMNAPDKARFVQCTTPHVFEVAGSVDTRNSQELCQQAVQRYLGTRYDPDSKFTIAVLSSGAPDTRLCGLQLHGPDGEPIALRGKVAELDQSKVWPAGTCLGIDAASDQSTAVPVDCSAPHAEEITGVVNLGEQWHDGPPSEHDQDDYIADACARTTDAYLSPTALETTGLTLVYRTVSPQSWSAGSRQVLCRIGATLGDRGWATLVGSAKDRVRISGVATVRSVSDVREDAADQPPIAASTTVSTPSPSPSPAPSPAPGPAQAQIPPSVTASPSPSPASTPDVEAAAAPVIEIPGFPPIALHWLAPPPPPPGT